MHNFCIFLLTFFTTSFFVLEFSNAKIFSMEMHHKFSEPVKKWYQNTVPIKGSVEYYSQLVDHDHTLHSRKLSEFKKMLTFSDGNSTFRLSSLGFLHYTTVNLGTPGSKFMVALDTGSDLFWVPCECEKCASTDDAVYSSDFELNIYKLNGSSTGKKVSCSDSSCSHNDVCQDTLDHCPYSVSYVSSETSTSGMLMEDFLHLKSEGSDQEVVQAEVIFGCGQVQTGSFLDVAAPNGLFGLGFEKISVPSMLSNEGYTANSFSMCFGHDGAGRINFGDKGSIDQEETSFNMNLLHPSYNVTVGQIRVGTGLFDLEFTALFDSGTSFTYLVDPAYTRLSENVSD
ncbi:hypothetical protein Leryth_019372 [Lithospermum erythrorhizon]|nr:hypothetical protein Leryth_019372 [Lithospermum erythrorhizon]